MGSGQTVEAEERQGKALVDESIKQGVRFFVYTSVDRGGDASFDNPTNIPHFISKHRIEHHLVDQTKHGEMDWTIIRPTAFFDNMVPGFMFKGFVTSWKIGLKGKPLQCIAVSDIGYFGSLAFLKPDEFKGKCISLAGDELTFDQLAKTFKAKTGKDIPMTYEFICHLLMWFVKDFGAMFRWFHEHGYKANIGELKKIHPGLKDFGAWLETDSQFMKH
jgi:nucleoside-diphosphate-sugar epimerase